VSARESAREPPCARQKAKRRACGRYWEEVRCHAAHPQPQVALELAQRARVQEVDAAQHRVVDSAAGGLGRRDGNGAALCRRSRRRLGRGRRSGGLHLLAVSPQRLELLLVLRRALGRRQRRAAAVAPAAVAPRPRLSRLDGAQEVCF